MQHSDCVASLFAAHRIVRRVFTDHPLLSNNPYAQRNACVVCCLLCVDVMSPCYHAADGRVRDGMDRLPYQWDLFVYGTPGTVTNPRMEWVAPTPWGWLGSDFFIRGWCTYVCELCLISLGFCDLVLRVVVRICWMVPCFGMGLVLGYLL